MKMQNNGFGNKEIKFPVSYDLKVIMLSNENHEENTQLIEPIFSALNIKYKTWSNRPSGKGTYTSYSINVQIKDQNTMNKLYEELKKIPQVKMAL